jgi:hypothetical protein
MPNNYENVIIIGQNVVNGTNDPTTPPVVNPGNSDTQNLTRNIDTTPYINLPAYQILFATNLSPPPIAIIDIPNIISTNGTFQVVSVGSGSNIQQLGEINMATSGFWKCTMAINNGKYGHLESHVYNGGNLSTINTVSIQALLLIQDRDDMLGNIQNTQQNEKSLGTPVIEFLRISDAVNPRYSQLFSYGSAYQGKYNIVGISPDVFSTALTVRLRGQNTTDAGVQSAANLQIIGQPDGAVVNAQYVPGFTMGDGDTINSLFARYVQRLTNDTSKWGYMGLDTAGQPLNFIAAISNTAGTVTCTVPAHGYFNGDTIKIQSANTPGWNKTYKVNGVTTNTFNLVGFIPTSLLLPTSARCRRIAFGPNAGPNKNQKCVSFYKYQPPLVGNPGNVTVSKKDLAKEMFGHSFRRRVRKPISVNQ